MVSALRASRGRWPASVAAPAKVRKSRRRIVMTQSPRVATTLLANFLSNFHVLPAFLFAGGLEDRGFGQGFGFLGGSRRLVEFAGVGGFLRRRQCCGRRGPLIAQRACFLVGGFGGGIGG